MLIAGGGIGGLAAALALAKGGQSVEVLERGEAFATAGAGIQLGPNAIKVLRRLGVADAVEARASVPDALDIYDGRSGRRLNRIPFGATIAKRCGAPYWTLHRADLLQALADATDLSKLISVSFGREVVRADSGGDGVSLTFADGSTARSRALIGADGVWSRVRETVAPGFTAVPSGYCAYRALLPIDLAGDLDTHGVGAWLSPKVHVIHYPVQAGRTLNIVVVVRDPCTAAGWSAPADRAAVLAATDGLSPRMNNAIAAAPQWHKWSLPKPISLAQWNNGAVALVGDAAHGMLPFFAQGGVMALEDAAALAAHVAKSPDDLVAAFAGYHRGRAERVARVQAASVDNGRIFHMGGAMAVARDTVMRVTPGAALLSRFDWLYGYDGPQI